MVQEVAAKSTPVLDFVTSYPRASATPQFIYGSGPTTGTGCTIRLAPTTAVQRWIAVINPVDWAEAATTLHSEDADCQFGAVNQIRPINSNARISKIAIIALAAANGDGLKHSNPASVTEADVLQNMIRFSFVGEVYRAEIGVLAAPVNDQQAHMICKGLI